MTVSGNGRETVIVTATATATIATIVTTAIAVSVAPPVMKRVSDMGTISRRMQILTCSLSDTPAPPHDELDVAE